MGERKSVLLRPPRQISEGGSDLAELEKALTGDKRGRPWPEKSETPTKFRAGVAGPHCRCCGKMHGPKLAKLRKMRRHIIRRREKVALRKEEE